MLKKSKFKDNLIGVKTYVKSIVNSLDGEELYLLGMTCLIFNAIFKWTMFDVPGAIEKLIGFLGWCCLLLKVTYYDCYSKKTLVYSFLFLLLGYIISVNCQKNIIFEWIAYFVCAQGVHFEKLLKIYVVIGLGTLMSCGLAAELGLIPDLIYYNPTEGYVRNSFGTVFPTDFSALCFFIMASYLYVDRNKLGYGMLLLCTGMIYVIYIYCHTRLDCLCMLLVVLGFTYLTLLKRNPWKIHVGVFLLRKYSCYAMLASMVIIMALSYFYNPEIEGLKTLDKVLSGRLELGYKGLHSYPLCFLGNKVTMKGFGGTNINPDYYFMLDSSYLISWLRYGAIFTFITILGYIKCCKKYFDDAHFLVCMVAIALNCAIAHHMIDVAYNLFPFALVCVKDTKIINKYSMFYGLKYKL